MTTWNEDAVKLLAVARGARQLEEIHALVGRFRREIPGCSVGGALHVVVDDANTDDIMIVRCP